MEAAHTPDAAGPDLRRRLTVILAADVAGYSRLVAEDEEDTLHRFNRAAEIFAACVSKHHGRVFNTAGDAILAEFPSALDATRCAIDFQEANNAAQDALPPPRQIRFRIGIATGDVVVTEAGDLLGDPVNVAARLESIAAPGGICISEDVRSHVLNKIRLNVIDLGEQKLRNIPRAIRAFKLVPPGADDSVPGEPRRRLALRRPRAWAAVGLAIVAAAALVLGTRSTWHTRPQWFMAQGSSSGASTRAFDPRLVPLVTDRVRANLADFPRQPDFKAIAISHIGWGVASGAADVVGAEREAIERCKKRDQKGECRIYAVGNDVVWPALPLPAPADLRAEPLDLALSAADVGGIKGMPSAAGLEAFLTERDHKALAISDVGFSAIANRPDRAEAVRLAVERCSDFSRAACLLVAVDGFLTVRIPRAYRAVRPYALAADAEMSEADRRAVGAIYAGPDWRALVRGGAGRWYAVSGVETETTAVEQALQACRGEDSDCRLRAVGNFRVDDRR